MRLAQASVPPPLPFLLCTLPDEGRLPLNAGNAWLALGRAPATVARA
jgi:hypothetical protein